VRVRGIGQSRGSLNRRNASDVYLGGLRLFVVILSHSKQVSQLVPDRFLSNNFHFFTDHPTIWAYLYNINTATGRIDGVRFLVGARDFSTPQCPDRLWATSSILSNGYGGLFPRRYSRRDVKLTIHFRRVPPATMVGLYIHSPILHVMVLN
jgi:hypothetical protein